ncbi:MAG: hypothetical protein ABI135_01155 [Rhodoferax sp.]
MSFLESCNRFFPERADESESGRSVCLSTLIAAELVFGVSPDKGSLGWHTLENRNQLATSNMFADLFFEITIGMVAGNLCLLRLRKALITVRHEARGPASFLTA